MKRKENVNLLLLLLSSKTRIVLVLSSRTRIVIVLLSLNVLKQYYRGVDK